MCTQQWPRSSYPKIRSPSSLESKFCLYFNRFIYLKIPLHVPLNRMSKFCSYWPKQLHTLRIYAMIPSVKLPQNTVDIPYLWKVSSINRCIFLNNSITIYPLQYVFMMVIAFRYYKICFQKKYMYFTEPSSIKFWLLWIIQNHMRRNQRKRPP